jgi:GMP synthase-like glutamine amidotransferase
MRALVVVHEPGSESVLVGKRLEHHGFEIVDAVVTAESGNPAGAFAPSDPTEYDLIVPMGSVYAVFDTERIGAWIDDELDLLRRADEAGVPIFGVCFGAQALAQALGGRVQRAEQHQVGWHPLTPDFESGLPHGPWMQWHYDRFEPPTDATVLAHDHIGVQAFTVRRNLGVQFHPEVTYEHVKGWIDGGGAAELIKIGVDPDQLLADTAGIEPDVTARTNRLVDWFLTDIAKL